MDVGTRFFWGLISVLLGASLYFGVHAEERRRAVQRPEGNVQTGDLVRLVRVMDADTLLVAGPDGENVAIRMVGVMAFGATAAKNDPAATIAQRSVEFLSRTLENEPVRVLVHNPPRDRFGRVLASLFVGDKDLGLTLVQKGLALVYTVYPFPSMPLYLQEQEAARAKRNGLWAEADMAQRADLLLKQWKQEAR